MSAEITGDEDNEADGLFQQPAKNSLKGWLIMRTHRLLFIFTLVLSLFLDGNAWAGEEEVKKVEAATEVVGQIMAVPEKGMPEALLRDAYGIAVIPGVIKVGFFVGGWHG